jgi:tRNA A58 N-methylase Trm61
MKILPLLRRYRWSILLLVIAGLAWKPLFDYLVDFRPPDVPFVTTPPDIVEAMLNLAQVNESDYVIDLGSGDGRIVLAAARRNAKSLGIELDPELVRTSRETVRNSGLSDKASIYRGDIFKQDLSDATVITMFLKPLVNVQLRPQLDALKPGVRIVSHMFSMPGAKPVQVIEPVAAEDGIGHKIYLWITPIEWEK